MKKILSLSILSLFITALFTSCGGGNQDLIVKEWTLKSVEGNDLVNEHVGNVKLNIKDDGNISANWFQDVDDEITLAEMEGTWILNEIGIPEDEGIADLIMTFTDGNEIILVKSLSESELVLEYSSGVKLIFE